MHSSVSPEFSRSFLGCTGTRAEGLLNETSNKLLFLLDSEFHLSALVPVQPKKDWTNSGDNTLLRLWSWFWYQLFPARWPEQKIQIGIPTLPTFIMIEDMASAMQFFIDELDSSRQKWLCVWGHVSKHNKSRYAYLNFPPRIPVSKLPSWYPFFWGGQVLKGSGIPWQPTNILNYDAELAF